MDGNYSGAPRLRPFWPSRIGKLCFEVPNGRIQGTPEQLQFGVSGNLLPYLNSYDG